MRDGQQQSGVRVVQDVFEVFAAPLPHAGNRWPDLGVVATVEQGREAHEFLTWLTARSRRLHYCVGFVVTQDIREAILNVPAEAWTAAYDGTRGQERRAWVADITGLRGTSRRRCERFRR